MAAGGARRRRRRRATREESSEGEGGGGSSDDEFDLLPCEALRERAAAAQTTVKAILVADFKLMSKAYGSGHASGSDKAFGRRQHYMQVGGAVDSLSEPLTWAMLAALKGKHGVGKSTVDKLRELWTTGYCGRVQGIRGNDRSMALIELQKLRGIGEKAAEKLWDRGIKSRADVQREAASLELPDATRAHLRYAWAEKVPRVAVEEIAALVKAAAHEAYGGRLSVEPTGSHRRGLAFSSDVDLLCVLENPESRTEHHDVLKRLVPLLKSSGLIVADLNNREGERADKYGGAKHAEADAYQSHQSVCELRGARYRLDLFVHPAWQRATAQLHYTGSGLFNRYVSRVANQTEIVWNGGVHNLSLSAIGIRPCRTMGGGEILPTGDFFEISSEAQIFELLEIKFMPPEARNQGKEAVIDVFTNKPWFDGTKDENRAARRQNRAAAALMPPPEAAPALLM